MGLSPGVKDTCGLSLLLVLPFALRGVSLGTLVFPCPQKPTFPNSNSTRNWVDEEPPSGGATSKSFLIYLFTLFLNQSGLWHFTILMLCGTKGRFHLASCKIKGSNSKPAWIFSGFHFTTAIVASIELCIDLLSFKGVNVLLHSWQDTRYSNKNSHWITPHLKYWTFGRFSMIHSLILSGDNRWSWSFLWDGGTTSHDIIDLALWQIYSLAHDFVW